MSVRHATHTSPAALRPYPVSTAEYPLRMRSSASAARAGTCAVGSGAAEAAAATCGCGGSTRGFMYFA